jgi:hypothetical protein
MNPLTTVGVSREAAIARCKTDLNFFAQICIPEIFRFDFPPVFLAVWQMLTDEGAKPTGQHRLAIGLPRGFGKTILLKLYVVWLILFTDRRFIVIVCNTASLAENFIADVVDILTSPNILRLFGDWRTAVEKDTQPLKIFTFCGRTVTLAALGSQSSLRGLNIKLVRPDVFVMDDMQSREEAESPAVALQVLVWMLGTLMKANDKFRCQFVFVANMYPFDGSILKKLRANAAWVTFICGAILADGNSVWPELRSVEDILDELENDLSMGHPEIFYSEVMNDDEAGNRAGVDITAINYWSEEPPPGQLPLYAEAGFVIVDPSVGRKKGDPVAIGCHLVFDGKPVLWDVVAGPFDPLQQIEECFKMAMKWGVLAVLIEGTAYQATLEFWMKRAMTRYGLESLRVLLIYPGHAAKTSRILDAFKLLTRKAPEPPELYLHPRVKAPILHQITQYKPLRKHNRDDLLDLLAYGPIAIRQFGMQLLRPYELPAYQSTAAYTEDLELPF